MAAIIPAKQAVTAFVCPPSDCSSLSVSRFHTFAMLSYPPVTILPGPPAPRATKTHETWFAGLNLSCGARQTRVNMRQEKGQEKGLERDVGGWGQQYSCSVRRRYPAR